MIRPAIAEPNILILNTFRNEDINHTTLTSLLIRFGMIGTSFFKGGVDD